MLKINCTTKYEPAKIEVEKLYPTTKLISAKTKGVVGKNYGNPLRLLHSNVMQ